jgi:flagellar secretion chaperone FliS
MNYGSSLTQRYQETSVNTASGEQLVVMLYEGAIKSLRTAVADIEAKNIEGKRQAVDKALGIVQHLQDTLDRERGGHIAADLDRLYTYIISRILDGSAKLEVAPIQEAVKLLTPLLSAWEEVARKKHETPVPAEVVAGGQAPHVRLQLHG